ncbi:hypothetical protein C1879_10095 [Paraeggerthella hongkongensis]|nr:hypothetical protein C1879_10095 [Paraeggerthella hongkongensis]
MKEARTNNQEDRFMKKKTIAIVAVIALVALAVPAVAFANAMPHAWMGLGQSARVQPVLADQEANAARGGYVDADQDGVCDNRVDGRGMGSGYVDANGDGVCDNRVDGRGMGSGYVDANGDGVCDNRGSAGYGQGQSQGQGQGKGFGPGRGAGCGYGAGCQRG